jgi:hypothetical protein
MPLWCDVRETILVCLTNLRSNNPSMLPMLTKKRSVRSDEDRRDHGLGATERDGTGYSVRGTGQLPVRGTAGQYWRVEKLKSFDEFLERRFPESRRKAYHLMSIHEHLPPQARKDLKEVGRTKGLELAKAARAEGQQFDCAIWLQKAREMPKEQFKREVEKELTGGETDPTRSSTSSSTRARSRWLSKLSRL